jgi:hypothetical protein
MITLALIVALTIAAPQQQEEQKDKPRVPKDSVELFVTGCLKGRVLAVSSVRSEDTQSGPIVRARTFRLQAKKEVMEDIKREDGHLVDVTGLVRKYALVEPGMKIGKGITITGGPPVAGSGSGSRPAPSTEYVPVMDVSGVRLRASSCSGGM